MLLTKHNDHNEQQLHECRKNKKMKEYRIKSIEQRKNRISNNGWRKRNNRDQKEQRGEKTEQ